MRINFRILAAGLLMIGLLYVQRAMGDDHWTGCLVGTNDNYVLKTADGEVYRLHSDKDLNEHVGQMVEVKGNRDNEHREREAKRQKDVAQEVGVTIPTKGIDVDDVKKIAGNCDAIARNKMVVTPIDNSAAPSKTVTTTVTTVTQQGGTAGATTAVQAAPAGAQAGVAVGAPVTTTSSTGVATSSDYQHWTGCLAGTHDNYVLRTDDGQLFRLHSDKDIHEHIGDMVDVRGRIDNSHPREAEAQQQAAAAQNAGVQVPTQGINVEDLKTVSHGCTQQ